MKKMMFVLPAAILASALVLSCKHDAVTTPQSTLLFPKVKAIIEENCVVCHSPGGEGLPVMLTTDDEIVQLAQQIKSATVDPASPRNRRMPPGGELTDADKNIIAEWFAGGGTTTN